MRAWPVLVLCALASWGAVVRSEVPVAARVEVLEQLVTHAEDRCADLERLVADQERRLDELAGRLAAR